jgi:hypothetical protein
MSAPHRPAFFALIPLAACVLAACGPQQTPSVPAAPSTPDAQDAHRPATPEPGADAPARDAGATPLLEDAAIGLRLDPVPELAPRDPGTGDGYLDGGGWNALAESGAQGQTLGAFVLAGSDDITTGELRIGRSDAPEAVRTCQAVPPGAAGPAEPAEIGGVAFSRFRAGDAGMSHFQTIEAYRAVHRGQCVAIDLVVSGTRPEVYDPPRQAPFDTETALARLRGTLPALHWSQMP